MKRSFGKFGFIHRRLWAEDGLYRAAFLFGPVPLLACLLAVAAWSGLHRIERAADHPLDWAVPSRANVRDDTGGVPLAVQPDRPLPPADAGGAFTGYEPGWRVTINPIQVGATLNVDVRPAPLSAFPLTGPAVDMADIVAGGPREGRYVGVGTGFLAIGTAGVYSVSARLERPADRAANCLVRMGLGPHRIMSNLELSIADDYLKSFAVASFDLRPGLYTLIWAFGCWRDHAVVGPGRLTILIGHPGDPAPRPLNDGEIVRMAHIAPR